MVPTLPLRVDATCRYFQSPRRVPFNARVANSAPPTRTTPTTPCSPLTLVLLALAHLMLLSSYNTLGTLAQTCTYSSFTFTTTAMNLGASCRNLLVETSTASGLTVGAQLANFDASTGSISLSFTGNTFKSQLDFGQTVSGLTIVGWTTAPSATITSVSIHIDSNSLGNATLALSGIFPSNTVVSISNNNFVQSYPDANDRIVNLYFGGMTMTGAGSSLIATSNTMYAADIESPTAYPSYNIYSDEWLLANAVNVTFSSNSITASGGLRAAIAAMFTSDSATYSLDVRSGASMNFIYNTIKISSTGSDKLYGVYSDMSAYVNGVAASGTMASSQWNIVGNFISVTAGISSVRGISFENTVNGDYTHALGVTGGALLSMSLNTISITSTVSAQTLHGIHFIPTTARLDFRSTISIVSSAFTINGRGYTRAIFIGSTSGITVSAKSVITIGACAMTISNSGTNNNFDATALMMKSTRVTLLRSSAFSINSVVATVLATSYPGTYGVALQSSFLTMRGRSLFVVGSSSFSTTTSAILSTSSSIGIDFSASVIDMKQQSLVSVESNVITSTGQAAYTTAFRTSGSVTIGSGSQLNFMLNSLTTANTPTAGLLIDGGVKFSLFQKSTFSFSQNTIPGDLVTGAMSTSASSFAIDATSHLAMGCDYVSGSVTYDNTTFPNIFPFMTSTLTSCSGTICDSSLSAFYSNTDSATVDGSNACTANCLDSSVGSYSTVLCAPPLDRSASASASWTESSSFSQSTSRDLSGSKSVTPSATATISQSSSGTVSVSVSASSTKSRTSSASVTQSMSAPASMTRSVSPTRSATSAVSATASRSASKSPSVVATRSTSGTASSSTSLSLSASSTASRTTTMNATVSSSQSKTKSVSVSRSGSQSATSSASSSETHSTSKTGNVSLTSSGSSSGSNTASVTASASTSATSSYSWTSTFTSTPIVTKSNTTSRTRSTSLTTSLSVSASTTQSQSQSSSVSGSQSGSHTASVSGSSSITTSASSSESDTQSSSATQNATSTQSVSHSTTASSSGSSSLTTSKSTSVSGSATSSFTKTRTASVSLSGSSSQSVSVSSSDTGSRSLTNSQSASLSASSSDTGSASTSLSLSVSASSTLNASVSASNSATTSVSSSYSHSTSVSLSSSATGSASLSQSLSATFSVSSSHSASQSLSASVSTSSTATSTASRSFSLTASVSQTGSISASVSSSTSGSATSSASHSSSISASTTPSSSASASVSSTHSASVSRSQTDSGTASITSSLSDSRSLTGTATASSTVSNSVSDSMSQSQSASASPSETHSASLSLSASSSSTQSATESTSDTSTSSISTSGSMTASLTGSSSGTASGSGSASASGTASVSTSTSTSASLTVSASPSASNSISTSASSSVTDSQSTSQSTSGSATESTTKSFSASASTSLSSSATASQSVSTSGTASMSSTSSASASITHSSSVSTSGSDSVSTTSSPSETSSASPSSSVSPSGSQSVSFSGSNSVSATLSVSESHSESVSTSTSSSGSLSQSASLSSTATASLSLSSSQSASASASASVTATPSATSSASPSASVSNSASFSTSISTSLSSTASTSISTSASESLSLSSSASISPSSSSTSSASATGSPTDTMSLSPSTSVSPSSTVSYSMSGSATPTQSQTNSFSGSATATTSSSVSYSSSPSYSTTVSMSASASMSASHSASSSTSGTNTQSSSASASATPTLSTSSSTSVSNSVSTTTTSSLSWTTSVSASPSLTASSSASGSLTSSISNSGTQSHTESFSSSASPSNTASPSASASPSLTSSTSASSSSSLTSSGSFTQSVSSTASTSASSTQSASPSVTASPSASSSASNSFTETSSLSTSVSASGTNSASTSASPTATASPTSSESVSQSASQSPSLSSSGTTTDSTSLSATKSESASESVTRSASTSLTFSLSPSASASASTSQSLSGSASTSPTASASPSKSESVTTSLSASATISASQSVSATQSQSDSSSASASGSISISSSMSLTESISSSSSASPTSSSTPSQSASVSTSSSVSSSVTSSPSQSESPTMTASISTSGSMSQSVSASLSASGSQSASLTASPSTTISPSTSASTSASFSLTPSTSSSPSTSLSGSPSTSISPTASDSPSISSTPSGSQSASPSESVSPTDSSSVSQTSSISASTSSTASETASASMTTTTSISSSASPSTSVSPSSSKSASQSDTASPSFTASPSTSSTPSMSSSETHSNSVSTTETQSASLTTSTSPSASVSPSASTSPSVSSSVSPSASGSPTETTSPSTTESNSMTESASPSTSTSPTDSDTPSTTTSLSTSQSKSPSDSFSPSATTSESQSSSESLSQSSSTSISSSLSTTTSDSRTVSDSVSESESASSTSSLSSSESPSGTSTQSPTDSSSPTVTQTLTTTSSGSATTSQSHSGTFSISESASGTPTVTSTITPPPTPTPTYTASMTSSESFTYSESGTSSDSPTSSATPSTTESSSPTESVSPSVSGSPSVTASPSTTSSASPTYSLSPTESVSPTTTRSLSPTKTLSPTATQSKTPSLSLSQMCIWYYETTTDDLPKNTTFIPPTPDGYSVDSVEGCDDTFPSTGNCPQSGVKELYVRGRSLSVAVNVSFIFADGQIVSCMDHFYSDSSLIVCRSYTGNGTDGSIFLHSPASTEFVFYSNPNVTISFQATVNIDCGVNSTCNGNGRCDPVEGCQCFSNSNNGFWNGSYCDRCQDLKYGPSCTSSCDGPCKCVEGVCSDGRNGTGCVCTRDKFLGYWDGQTCEVCLGQYFGEICTSACPGRVNETVACDLGNCSDGLRGTGLCTCNAGALLDVNGSCTICDAGYYGKNCSLCGRPNTTIAPCYGNGVCSEGRTGTGTCVCNLGFVGSRCQRQCAVAVNGSGVLTACGRGNCTSNFVCACQGNWTVDPATGACTTCKSGFYGPNCNLTCPDCHRGNCSQGPQGDGTCKCNYGAWGEFCTEVCPGPSSAPCYSHGACSVTNGTCSCYSNATSGFWRGLYCNQCERSYLSTACTIACPVVNGVICNGRGICFNGQCSSCRPVYPDPYSVVCGNDCNTYDYACAPSTSCPLGKWGATCSNFCPAAVTNASNACNAKGFCVPATGVCECFFGIGGPTCLLSCPRAIGSTGVIYPCAGNGLCNVNGTCTCTSGYYGDACEYECPGGATNACNGNGNCTTLGFCQCFGGFYGALCDGICPGGVSNPCSSQGLCNGLGQCTCYANSTAGFFGGNSCQECRTGYSGSTCLDVCNPTTASSVNQQCICNAGYAGADCTIACPGISTNAICNSRGTCLDGNSGNGTCVCDTSYYGTSCTVACTAAICLSTRGLVNSMCNSNGTCTCLQNSVSHFGGTTCETCADGYWGVVCNLPCDCSLHGYCMQYTGTCVCYADNANGYWTGTHCSTCRTGYMGANCHIRNMQLSTKSSVTAAVEMQSYTTPSMSVRGSDNFFAVGGSQPVLFFNITSNGSLNFYGSVDVGGVIIGMAAPVDGSVDIWTVGNSSSAVSLQRKRVYFANISHVVLVSSLVNAAEGFADARRHHHELAAFAGYASRFLFNSAVNVLVSFFNNNTNTSTLSITSLATGVTTTFNTTITKLIWVQFDRAGQLVTVSGSTYGGLWEADVFTISAVTGVTTFFMELSNATRTVDLCGNTTNRCTAASLCTYYASRNEMYCILRRAADGAIYAAFAMDNATTDALTTLELYTTGSDDFNVTAVTEDPYFAIAIVAIDFAGSSSVIFQINGSHPASILSQIDPPSTSMVQIVSTMFVDLTERILYTIRQAEFSAAMYQINLFGVTDITPNILDSAGETPVIIKGYGFAPLQPLQCNFGRSLVSNATVIDNYTISCNTTVENAGGDGCIVLFFNLVSGSRSTAATNTPITRMAGVTLDAAVDGDGLVGYTGIDAATTITLQGFGFVSSEWARCRMVDANGTVLQDLNPVTFIGGNSAACTMPAISGPTIPPTYIEYSHDGTIYSPSRAEFAVVGDAYDIVGGFEDVATNDVSSAETLVTVTASSLTRIPTMIGFLVDRYGNRRGALETASTAFQVTTAVNTGDVETLPFANASIRKVYMVDGVVSFSSVILELPLIGTYTLYMKSLVYTGLEASFSFSVIAGAPYRVSLTNVTRMLSVWTIPVTSASILQPSPVVVIVDVAGNIITNTTLLPAQVVLQYANAYENQTSGDVYFRTLSAAAQPDEVGEYTFTGVSVQTVYSSSFVFSFSASVEYGNSPIGTYLTPAITTETCVPGAEYAIAGTFTCLPCPEFGVCDGSASVTPMSGYWRGSLESYAFYSCAPPDGADSCANGVATCDDGYVGPRCSSCAVGYGKSGSSCAVCLDSTFNWGISWLIFFIIVGVAAFLVIRSIMDVSDGVTPEKTVVVLKSLVTHAQVLGALVALLDVNDMPSFFAQFFQAGGQAKLSLNLSFFSCAIAHDALDSYIFALVIPWILVAFVAIIVLGRGAAYYYLGYRVEALKNAFREKRHKARAKKSMFHKSSESYDILASMGAHHIEVHNLDTADDDVDPHEIAIYRMEAFGDDDPSTDDEEDEFILTRRSSGSTTANSIKATIEAPMPLTGAARRDSSTPQKFDMPELKSDAKKKAIAQSSAMTSLAHRKESMRRLKKEERDATRSMRNSKRVIRIVDGPPTGDEPSTPLHLMTSQTSTSPPVSPTTVLSPVAVPQGGSVRNPLDSRPNPLVPPHYGGIPHPTTYNDGGDAEVSAAATDPAGFGAVAPLARPKNATVTSLPDDATPQATFSAVGRPPLSSKFSLRGDGDLSKFTPQQTDLDNSKAAKALASFRESARRNTLEKSGKSKSFSKSLSASGNRLRQVALAAKKKKSNLNDSITSSTEELMQQPYIPTFGFPLPKFTDHLSVPAQIVHSVALIFLVVMFLLYPTVINACLSLFPCESIDYGTHTESVLIAERTIDCRARWFSTYRVSAGIMLIVYGLGVPAASFGLVHFLRAFTVDGNMEAAKMVFFFATGGFRKAMWFWESITMLRKASILIIVTMLTDPTERRYVASVGMTLFFVLNWFAKPFGEKVLHAVETISLLDIAITTNLFMLFPFFPYSSNPVEYTVVVVAVFAVNMLTLLAFAYGIFTSAADALFKTSLYNAITQPSPAEVMRRHKLVVTGLETTRRMCRVVHPRTYEMDEFLYEAYSLAVLGNARLEKMGKEVVSHTRRLRKHARRNGEDEVAVANLVSSMLLPTTTAFETKLRDVLEDATNAIVYVGAMRAFASTQVQQALSSTDEAYLDKVADCVEELYRAEINVLQTSKKLRKALRRLGGSAGEFRDELSSDSSDSDDHLFDDDNDENSPKATARRQMESEWMFRDFEEERRALNRTFQFDQTSIAESDVFSDHGSQRLDDEDYFSMLEQRQSTIAKKLQQNSYKRDPALPHYFRDEEEEKPAVDAVPMVSSTRTADQQQNSTRAPEDTGYAFGSSDPYSAMFHTPEEQEDETDYMAILEAGRVDDTIGTASTAGFSSSSSLK